MNSSKGKRRIEVIDPLKPSASLLSKLASALQHVAEALGARGHPFDWQAYEACVNSREVVEWMQQMDELGLVPKMRR